MWPRWLIERTMTYMWFVWHQLVYPMRPSDAYTHRQQMPSLVPVRHQAIIWANAGLLSNGSLGTNFCDILIEIQTHLFKKIIWKWSDVCKLASICINRNMDRYALNDHISKAVIMPRMSARRLYACPPESTEQKKHIRWQCKVAWPVDRLTIDQFLTLGDLIDALCAASLLGTRHINYYLYIC